MKAAPPAKTHAAVDHHHMDSQADHANKLHGNASQKQKEDIARAMDRS